ncbi:LOW QUALITY PROTEIN: Transposable element P transposase [Frankliniella fusca]|uniref:Transposable element P transposase n=1 Tax=Frankliniella fusca TaxID=407009 RepID=A0AAE1LCD9_9NEOP|nr:LOW QUALITY PROTEIN: Transposable element P transposase [Frankliniella fusca]
MGESLGWDLNKSFNPPLSCENYDDNGETDFFESANDEPLNGDTDQSSSRQGTQHTLSIDHEYSSHASSSIKGSNNTTDTATQSVCTSVIEDVPLQDLYVEVKEKVDIFLTRRWITTFDRDCFRIVYISAQNNVSVQRSLEFFQSGECKFFVHCKEQSVDNFVKDIKPPLPLDCDSINYFVDRAVSIVNIVRKLEICSGFDDEKYRVAWATCPFGEIDKNPYRECRYIETFRALNCKRLVSMALCRVYEAGALKRRTEAALLESRDPRTNNRFLTEEQKMIKLLEQQQEIENTRRKVTRLQDKMQDLIKKQSVSIDPSMSDAFSEILNSCNLSPAQSQSVFLQQQVKASQQKNACSMKWHPTMIRLALAIHLTSPAAYELIRDTGMVKLPSSRTLFDYIHASEVKEGIDGVVIEKLAEKVENMTNEVDPNDPSKRLTHKKYHVLMGDEMYISQNLVFDKFKGKLIGFTSLDEIEQEVKKKIECHLDNPEKEIEETQATKIMVYMVKGVSNGVKEVVATYASNKLTATQMKSWTWQVIGALERSGVAVIAFVCDGSATNRSFIKKNKPATIHPSGIIFDTINKCARDRNLSFLSDVPHLLKTVRNCLLNSKWEKLKSRRRMMKNRKRITWDFITKLYEQSQGKTLRKSYKLNAMNVDPDSYARMKRFNDWFDCLNGAHTSLAKKKRNPNLAPYTSVDDERFALLEDFLKYLDEWQEEAENANTSIVSNIDLNATATAEGAGLDISEIEGEDTHEEITHSSRRQLSKQTLEGLRMTTLAFRPLGWAGHGGSNNPNLHQCLKKMRAIHIFGELGIRKRKGNSGEDGGNVKVTTEPLAK